MTEVLLMVALTAISGPYPDGLDLYGVTLEWQKRSWWSLW